MCERVLLLVFGRVCVCIIVRSHASLQVGIGGVVKLADFGELGRLGAQQADGCSSPEVLRKVSDDL